MGSLPGTRSVGRGGDGAESAACVRAKKFMCSRNICVLPKPEIRGRRTCGMSHTSRTRLLPIYRPSDMMAKYKWAKIPEI